LIVRRTGFGRGVFHPAVLQYLIAVSPQLFAVEPHFFSFG